MIDPTDTPDVPATADIPADAAAEPVATTEPATTDTPPPVDPVDATLAAMTGEPAPAADPVAALPVADVAPAATTVPEPAKEPAKPTPEEAKARVDAEIADLGIKNERAAARFRDLSTRAAEVEPLKAQVQQLEVFRQRAIEWEDAVTSTGAPPEQFAMTMNYLTLINSGNPENLEVAFAQIEEEYFSLGKLMGKAVGNNDPLQDHPDLQAKVAALDIDNDTALELVRLRTKAKLGEVTTNVRTEQDSAVRAQNDGLAAVAALGDELRASDPQFAAKFAMVKPLVEQIQTAYPPAQWPALIRQLWANIPAMPTAVTSPTPKPTVAPLRPAATSAGQIRSFTDPVDATLAAMAGARQV
ncbi:MAG: hypothetical protein V4636_20030 [Pseudomonadota bacterium]